MEIKVTQYTLDEYLETTGQDMEMAADTLSITKEQLLYADFVGVRIEDYENRFFTRCFRRVRTSVVQAIQEAIEICIDDYNIYCKK